MRREISGLVGRDREASVELSKVSGLMHVLLPGPEQTHSIHSHSFISTFHASRAPSFTFTLAVTFFVLNLVLLNLLIAMMASTFANVS